MKQKINKNVYWSEILVNALVKLGVKEVCISPGSRSTSLVFAFSKNTSIKKHVIIDERASGFYALGIAKKTNSPVCIVTTSGTAVSELYPAVVEAYYSRIPLILLTADRPSSLKNCGSNQTINQDDIFHNHIKYFANTGLPELSQNSIEKFIKTIKESFYTCSFSNKGPVHLNLPFEKPFEPDQLAVEFTDDISESLISNLSFNKKSESKINKLSIDNICDQISKSKRLIFLCGPGNYSDSFRNALIGFSNKFNIPIISDGLSGFRSCNKLSKNIIDNADSILRTKKDSLLLEFDLAIKFGSAFTTNKLLQYYEDIPFNKISINPDGDLLDPSKTTNSLIQSDYLQFLEILSERIIEKKLSAEFSQNIEDLVILNKFINKYKYDFFTKTNTLFEGKFLNLMMDRIPDNSNVFLSNSLIVRDYDFFSTSTDKKTNVYFNRGASGIDGIIATAAGITSTSQNHTILVTGDLAFLYDLNSLWILREYNLPLTIILINNNGGGIFGLLPVAKHNEVFNKYFNTPTNLNTKTIVDSFHGNYYNAKTYEEFVQNINLSLKNDAFSVVEININSNDTLSIRKNYWKRLREQIESKNQSENNI